jgi:hypothetical protein
MADLMLQAKPVVDRFSELSEDDLFEELGKRLRTIEIDPAASGHFELSGEVPVETYGLSTDLREFGRRYLRRVNRQAFELVCGTDAAASTERSQLLNAFGLGREAVAAALTALLIAQLGIAPLVGVAVAAVIMRLVFTPTHGAMCDVWAAKFADGKTP